MSKVLTPEIQSLNKKKILSIDIKKGMIIEVCDKYPAKNKTCYPEQQAQIGDVVLVKEMLCGSGFKCRLLREDGKDKDVYISNAESIYNGSINRYETTPPQYHLQLIGDEFKRYEEIKNNLIRSNIVGFIDRGRNAGYNTGSDPEMFVVDEHGVVIPAFDFLSSQSKIKADAYRSEDTYGKPYYDGFQAEYNVNPGPCHANLGDQLRRGLQNLLALAKKYNPKATLSHESVVEIPKEMMDRVTEKQAGLGCSPSLNAYNAEQLYVEDPKTLPIRFAGCHIHFSLPHNLQTQELITQRVITIDRIAGPIMTSMLAGIEDPRRRQFYGKAGEFRMPTHGMEYRVPSSTVLCHPIVAHLTFDLVRFAKQFAEMNLQNLWKMPGGEDQTQDILNNYNIDEARRILRLNEKLLDQMITICYSVANGTVDSIINLSKEKFDKIKAIIMEGVKEHLPYKDIAKNWKLNPKQIWKSHSGSINSCVVNMRTTKMNNIDEDLEDAD